MKKEEKKDKVRLLIALQHWIKVLEKSGCDSQSYRKLVLAELLKIINKLI